MLISLNYAIFLLAITLSIDLFRREPTFREAAVHLSLFALAALLGGIAHHMAEDPMAINRFSYWANQHLPMHFKVSTYTNLKIRVWMATFLAIGLTEYYFMRIFLHPIADQLGFQWIKKVLIGSLAAFCIATLFISEYTLVVCYHLFTHCLVIGFSLYLIFKLGLTLFWQLIFLVSFNLLAGAVWSFMALGTIPSGPLHYNDWYHILIILFIVYLHWTLTKGGLAQGLQNLQRSSTAPPIELESPALEAD